MAVFRLGLIGAGRMGQTHLRSLAGSTQVRISAVADPDATVRDTLAASGLTVFASSAELLDRRHVDGVLIATPTDRHLEVVRQAASAGLPILCEKPCGLHAEEAQAAAVVAARAGVVLQVAYWRRFVPALRNLRRAIGDGGFGGLYFVACYQWDGTPPAATFRSRSGGIFVDMGVHEFDQIRWLCGQDITRIESACAEAYEGERVDSDVESAQALCVLGQGVTGLVSLGRRHPAGDVCWVEVFGTRNAAEARFLWPPDGDATFHLALRLQAEAFAQRVTSGDGEGATADDAVAALRAAERAKISRRPSQHGP